MDSPTLGHVLAGLAALTALGAILSGLKWARYSNELRGTPLYARKRDARRLAIWLAVAAVLFLVLGCFTPLGEIALGSG